MQIFGCFFDSVLLPWGEWREPVKCVKKKEKVIHHQFFVISTGASCHGASCPWGKLSVGRVVRGASCPWGQLSLGRVVHGASCPWGELSMVRVVHGASCPWGELSMGRVVHGARCRGASFDGAGCPWGELSWGEWSGNLEMWVGGGGGVGGIAPASFTAPYPSPQRPLPVTGWSGDHTGKIAKL
jgi:hypothetical protein